MLNNHHHTHQCSHEGCGHHHEEFEHVSDEEMHDEENIEENTPTVVKAKPQVKPSTLELKSELVSREPLPLQQRPIACIVVGMAGSGKTTLMQRINAYVYEKQHPSYIINLDPAVLDVPYGANIDIRDTVNYKEVMKQYNLGPNGGILTSLNLFATRFDQVIDLIDRKSRTGFDAGMSMTSNSLEKKKNLEYVFIDTPGQIEIFTWSASGQIISEGLASSFPTCIIYVIDTSRNTSPITFMSNMLYACSILYKTRLPFLIVFNKIDVVRHEFVKEWMKDYEAFQDALSKDESYSSSLAHSMSLVLDEFYENIDTVGVSAMTGEGMDEFFKIINEKSKEYEETYYQDLLEQEKLKQAEKLKQQEEDMRRLEQDFKRFNTASKKAPTEDEQLQDFLQNLKEEQHK
ncbi:hypothetical protein C9374_003723 [Naegleria lovaniensis]|uniref:GPN-loop GTPase n=1 Tax=Naegleria lovaniensis TaxID=51637 RepID=A0AA88H0H4_NAELO|nr:uncharacterized protein C9374_003723 [Naegleria lovaniensis]KAG2393959.1 hypothetical protein C9374_003723 [Naegleria lovaniensis]